MKSFAMLETDPVNIGSGERHHFIDGKRVTQDEYCALVRQAKRHDSFQTYRLGDRWHNRSVIYV